MTLRGHFHQAAERANAPIVRKYLSQLETLKSEFTRLGKLEAAVQVQNEINKISSVPSIVERAEFAGKWDWDPRNNETLVIHPDGKVVHAIHGTALLEKFEGKLGFRFHDSPSPKMKGKFFELRAKSKNTLVRYLGGQPGIMKRVD